MMTAIRDNILETIILIMILAAFFLCGCTMFGESSPLSAKTQDDIRNIRKSQDKSERNYDQVQGDILEMKETLNLTYTLTNKVVNQNKTTNNETWPYVVIICSMLFIAGGMAYLYFDRTYKRFGRK